MNTRYFPPCCTPPEPLWQLPKLPHQTHLLGCSFFADRWQATHSTQMGLPSMQAIAKRQAEFLAGRLCAREALILLEQPKPLVIDTNGRIPCWPKGCTGSITHSNGYAAALASSTQVLIGAGIDLEKRLSAERATRLAGQIHTPAEWQRIADLDEQTRSFCTTLAFSLKESLYKALNPLVQTQFYFHDAELVHFSPEGLATLRLNKDLSPTFKAGTELEGQFTQWGEFVLCAVLIAQAEFACVATRG